MPSVHNRIVCICLTIAALGAAMMPSSAFSQDCLAEPSDASSTFSDVTSLPASVPCSIAAQGDVDWYRVQMIAGQGYEFDVSSATNLDTALELYGPGDASGVPTGGLVAQGDDEVGLMPQIIYTAQASGFYFLKLKVSDTAVPLSQTGAYTLEVFEFLPDNDDTPPNATVVIPPAANDYAIGSDGDVDWFKIELADGVTYDFAVSSTTDFDSALWLYGPGTEDGSSTGPLVASDDDGGPSVQPLIAYPALASGWYYLRVAYSFNSPSAPMAKGSVLVAEAQADVGPYSLSVTSDVPLAVELDFFRATVVSEQSVMLKWRTVSESNNLGFEVQLRPSHTAVPAEWRTWGHIASTSNGSEGVSYAHTISDLSPGAYDARLRIIGSDGVAGYSTEISVSIREEQFRIEPIFPNPAQSVATFPLTVPTDQYVRIDLYDLLGKKVLHVFDGDVEANVLHSMRLDVAGLPPGFYLLRLDGDTFRATEAMTVSR